MKSGIAIGLGLATLATMAFAADQGMDSPVKPASEKSITAYDHSTTYGSNRIRLVLTQGAGVNQYTTLVNDKVVASASVAGNASNEAFAAYVDTTAKAISGVGGDPAQYGMAISTPTINDSGIDTAGLTALFKNAPKPAASDAPLAKSAE